MIIELHKINNDNWITRNKLSILVRLHLVIVLNYTH